MRGSGGDLSTSLCVLYFMWCVCVWGGRGQLTGSLLPLWVLGIRLGSSGGSVSASTTEPPRWPGLCVLYSPNVEELQRVKGICRGKMSTRVIGSLKMCTPGPHTGTSESMSLRFADHRPVIKPAFWAGFLEAVSHHVDQAGLSWPCDPPAPAPHYWDYRQTPLYLPSRLKKKYSLYGCVHEFSNLHVLLWYYMYIL